MNGYGGDSTGGLTQSANTIIQFLIPPSGPAATATINTTAYPNGATVVSGQPGITRPTVIQYTNAQTLQVLTVMRPIGKTTLNADAAASQATINLVADPGLAATNNLAANDFLGIREADGITRLYKVNNIASPQQLNLTASLAVGAKAGASVWDFGITTDTDPRNGAAHGTILQTVNTTTNTTDRDTGVYPSHEVDSPVLINSSNLGPGAGTLAFCSWTYTRY